MMDSDEVVNGGDAPVASRTRRTEGADSADNGGIKCSYCKLETYPDTGIKLCKCDNRWIHVDCIRKNGSKIKSNDFCNKCNTKLNYHSILRGDIRTCMDVSPYWPYVALVCNAFTTCIYIGLMEARTVEKPDNMVFLPLAIAAVMYLVISKFLYPYNFLHLKEIKFPLFYRKLEATCYFGPIVCLILSCHVVGILIRDNFEPFGEGAYEAFHPDAITFSIGMAVAVGLGLFYIIIDFCINLYASAYYPDFFSEYNISGRLHSTANKPIRVNDV